MQGALRITPGSFYKALVRWQLKLTNVVLIELLRRADSMVGSHNGICSNLEPRISTELWEINILFT